MNERTTSNGRPAVRFGAAYYAEYQRDADVAADLDLMAAAGFSVIRVGESVWSTWEPADGRFDLDWLEPVLDAARERDIGVILGTPTYAVPMWLARRHPEIAARPSTAGGWAGAPGRRSTSRTRRTGSTRSASSARSWAVTTSTRR